MVNDHTCFYVKLCKMQKITEELSILLIFSIDYFWVLLKFY